MDKTKVKVNGEEKEIKTGTSVEELLKEMNMAGMFVVELNLDVLPKEKYSAILQEGDSVEVVGFFGGG